MPEIKSGLGSISFKSTDDKLFTIPDESGHEESREQEEAPARPRRSEQPAQRQISPEEYNQYRTKMAQESKAHQVRNSKNRIEMLTGITRGLREVKVMDQVFHLRTLKGREMWHVLGTASSLSKEDQAVTGLFKLRILTLAYSLYAIDGVDIDILLDIHGADEEFRLDQRMAYIEEFDETLLQLLHMNYEQLTKENNEKFGIKNSQDAKEVSKEMKKSSSGA